MRHFSFVTPLDPVPFQLSASVVTREFLVHLPTEERQPHPIIHIYPLYQPTSIKKLHDPLSSPSNDGFVGLHDPLSSNNYVHMMVIDCMTLYQTLSQMMFIV